MREILFRGKRVENGVWVYGSLLIDCDNSRMIIPSGKGVFAGEKVITESVGQFTGLLDKNGNKIFEGDVIDYCGFSVTIWFQTGWGVASYGNGYNGLNSYTSVESFYKNEVKEWKVIGNIHE